jgi:hypothetical protein
MPKMTAKYSTALIEANRRGLPTDGDQEALYQRLQKAGLMWDSSNKEWLYLPDEPADPATPLVMIRVWADAEIVEEMADLIQGLLTKRNFTATKRAGVYLCRPPKQLEGRVYLEFMPPKKGKWKE